MRNLLKLILVLFVGMYTTPIVNAQDKVLKMADTMPTFGTCDTVVTKTEKKQCSDQAIYAFFGQNIIYPDSAYQKGTEGTVVLQFIIDENGTVTSPTVVRDAGDGCGEEALRVLNTMPTWKPGSHKGKKEKVMMYLPIKFKIKSIPLTIRTEVFEYLSDLFCVNYLTEFVKAESIHAMADGELDGKNLCSVVDIVNGLSYLKMTLTQNGLAKSVESQDGTISPTMRSLLKETKSGDVLELEFRMLVQAEGTESFEKDVYKSVIVE